MEQNTCYLDMSVCEAARCICRIVEKAGLSSKMADCHELRRGDALYAMILVFEKYYARAGGRLSMTVVLDDVEGRTRVYWVVTGGSGVFKQSGDSKTAADHYGASLRETLLPYLPLD